MRNLESSIPGASSFQYKEFVKSNTATRFNINNQPNEIQWTNIEYLVKNVLQPLRNKLGRIRINSGFRSDELNKKIGGSTTSFHSYGQAADIIPLRSGITNFDLLKHIYYNLNFTELIYEFPPDGWVHVAIDINRPLDKILKLKDLKHNYKRVSLDYIESGDYTRI